MKMRYLLGAIILACPPVAAAQNSPGGPAQPGTGGIRPTTLQKQMYEDIEVMRRLLARNLHTYTMAGCKSCHAEGVFLSRGAGKFTQLDQSGSLGKGTAYFDYDGDGWAELYFFNAHPHAGVDANPAQVEGAYLKGHGAIFNVTLPPSAHSVSATARPPVVKPLSDWDRTRLQLRGEKVPELQQEARAPALAEVILKLLAENGKHFRQLGLNEQLTVVVTFRAEPLAATGAGAGMMGPMGGGPMMGGAGVMMPGAGAPMGGSGMMMGGPGAPMGIAKGGPASPGMGPGMSGSGTSGGSAGGGSGSTNAPSTERDYELLADLHRKQGSWNEVVRAYENAIRLAGKVEVPADLPMQQAKDRIERATKRIRELSLKQAAALLELGRIEEARKLLDKAAAKPEVQATAAPAEKPKTAPPYKLIISVTKEAVDLVGSGKMTFDEFAKGASVEIVEAPAK